MTPPRPVGSSGRCLGQEGNTLRRDPSLAITTLITRLLVRRVPDLQTFPKLPKSEPDLRAGSPTPRPRRQDLAVWAQRVPSAWRDASPSAPHSVHEAGQFQSRPRGHGETTVPHAVTCVSRFIVLALGRGQGRCVAGARACVTSPQEAHRPVAAQTMNVRFCKRRRPGT